MLNKYFITVTSVIFLIHGTCFSHDVYLGQGEAMLTDFDFSGSLAFDKYDLISTLEKWHGGPIYLLTKYALMDLINSYLCKHFIIFVDGNTQLPLSISDFWYEKQTIRVEFYCDSKKKIKVMEIEHKVLINEFPDQVNALIINLRSKTKRFIFDKYNSRLKIL